MKGEEAFAFTVFMKKILLTLSALVLVLSASVLLSSCAPKNDAATTNKPSSNTNISTDSSDSSEDKGESSSIDSTSDTSSKPQDSVSSDSDSSNVTSGTPPTSDSGTTPDVPASPPAVEGTSGILRSESGTSLNLVLKYTIIESGDKRSIKVELGLDTYALYVSARSKTNKLIIAGTEYTFASDAIDYVGAAKTYIELYTDTFELTGSSNKIPVHAEWRFNGNYAGKDIDSLVIDAQIVF